MFPAYPHEWMDDRSRALATMFLLKAKRPDLILLHFVDHDSEAHEMGPFTRDAKGILEYTDELIGEIMRAMPRNYVLALVSDHGFERIDRVVNISAAMQGNFTVTPALLIANDDAAAAEIRDAAKNGELGIGREIPKQELSRFSDRFRNAAAVFEPVPHVMFGTAKDKLTTAPREVGAHGLWPGRPDYRSVFALWGQGIAKKRLPEMEMTAIAGRLAAILGVKLQ
ncbi:MAG: alkaline phosphatase family protein [Bryobacterales bacterium]|nr:alkaline phosphatase family protein [Bryobacterales bacterium]